MREGMARLWKSVSSYSFANVLNHGAKWRVHFATMHSFVVCLVDSPKVYLRDRVL